MNAVEIEAAVSALTLEPFDRTEFSFDFLAAFGNKETTLKRLRKGETNNSDVPEGVLQRNNIHLAVCETGDVSQTLRALKGSPKTTAAKAKFILATDGATLEAEDLLSGETIATAYSDFPQHFGFFLPLAGISTVREIKDNPIDVRATGRLNKLYVELLKDNPEWATEARRHDMNHFMARLIFCFFAEDTDIFHGKKLFTSNVEKMSERDAANTNEVISSIFHAMNVLPDERTAVGLPRWTDTFPYVNGGLFSGSTEVPKFSKMARTYLMHAGELSWRAINPDIFGSMIQAVADDEERGALGMHYTSVPNILKVLNPLFLDDLRQQLEIAGTNARTLQNLRKRIANIRVFDPACGSGNFLVIAYKEMRAIEAEINAKRDEPDRRTEISIKNFRGIEIRDFPAEIARLALIIAEFQCDVRYRGQKEALAAFLPLDDMNWITCGNGLRLDWLSVCPPTGTTVKFQSDDLFNTPLDQAQIDFENEGGETYICGNPPYLGSTWQSAGQKADLSSVFSNLTENWKSLDYVAGWFMKAADYGTKTNAASAFVSTNSICQGQQVPILWPLIFDLNHEIAFAHTSFKWANLASHKAGVTVVIVGISNLVGKQRRLYTSANDGNSVLKTVENINAYLVAGSNTVIEKSAKPRIKISEMTRGSAAVDGGHLLLAPQELLELGLSRDDRRNFIRHFVGSDELISGKIRYCIWVDDKHERLALKHPVLGLRLKKVKEFRLNSGKAATRSAAEQPHRFYEMKHDESATRTIVVPRVSSENRPYLPVDYLSSKCIIGDRNFAMYDAPLWNLALIASRLHWVWIGTVCVRMRTDFSYSNTLGWNTFPVPQLTDKHKDDLTRAAENILLAREVHFPKTIADLYDPEDMPDNLRRAHEQNDEILERIYIGRRFKNDTERLEKLFEMYTKMTAVQPTARKTRKSVQ
jgi:hypothetical protein